MLKRKAYNELIEWKKRRHDNGSKEVLVIKGARQVGKSYLVERFGEEYDSFIELNFIENPGLKNVFNGNKNPDYLYQMISLYKPDARFVPGNTLIFLDEIQVCGGARTALKFLASDLRFDFIASGSLLGLEYGEDGDPNVEVPESIPVGYEYPIIMHSLDFEEYLFAKGYNESQINYLKQFFMSNEKVPDEINLKFEQLFREYMVVGGMPEVVASFVRTNNFNDAIRIQNKILIDYQNDISKHAKGEQKTKIRRCYDSIPKQLAKEFKKFQYSLVEAKQTSRKYGDSIKWLKDSAIVNICYNTRQAFIPLVGNENEDQFKIYLNDTGLLTQIYGRDTKIALLENTLVGSVKGGIYENVIAEQLIKNGYTLHYYKPDDDHELEFLIEKNGQIIPIEVKAGNNLTVSLNDFVEKYKPSVAYKLVRGNIGINDKKITIPHYMIMFI